MKSPRNVNGGEEASFLKYRTVFLWKVSATTEHNRLDVQQPKVNDNPQFTIFLSKQRSGCTVGAIAPLDVFILRICVQFFPQVCFDFHRR